MKQTLLLLIAACSLISCRKEQPETQQTPVVISQGTVAAPIIVNLSENYPQDYYIYDQCTLENVHITGLLHDDFRIEIFPDRIHIIYDAKLDLQGIGENGRLYTGGGSTHYNIIFARTNDSLIYNVIDKETLTTKDGSDLYFMSKHRIRIDAQGNVLTDALDINTGCK